jgi:hypothetical protein
MHISIPGQPAEAVAAGAPGSHAGAEAHEQAGRRQLQVGDVQLPPEDLRPLERHAHAGHAQPHDVGEVPVPHLGHDDILINKCSAVQGKEGRKEGRKVSK